MIDADQVEFWFPHDHEEHFDAHVYGVAILMVDLPHWARAGHVAARRLERLRDAWG